MEVPYTDRVMLVQIKTNNCTLNLIQVYAPTVDKDEDEIEEFYNQIHKILKITKREEINIVMGD